MLRRCCLWLLLLPLLAAASSSYYPYSSGGNSTSRSGTYYSRYRNRYNNLYSNNSSSSTTSSTSTNSSIYNNTRTYLNSHMRRNSTDTPDPMAYYASPSDIRTDKIHSDLADVWLCLAVALGWTVWLLSAFRRNEVVQFQTDGQVVHGNVRQVTYLPGGDLPLYKVVVDYPWGEQQLRKTFDTQNKLEEGFANVALLVLPKEPSRAVLWEEWKEEAEEAQDICCCSTLWSKRMNIMLAAVLVLASVVGGLLQVHRMNPRHQDLGWVSVVVGVCLLLPAALWIHRVNVWLQRFMEGQLENCGDQLDVLDTRACEEDPASVDIDAVQTNVTETAGCYFIQMPKKKTRFKTNWTLPRSHGSLLSQGSAASSVSSLSLDRRASSLSGIVQGDDEDDGLVRDDEPSVRVVLPSVSRDNY